MNRPIYSTLSLVACFGFLAASIPLHAGPNSESDSSADPMRREHFTQKITQRLDVSYLLSLPEDYKASSRKSWPLVLFLHGAGERGTNLNAVAVHGPPKLVKQGRKFPFILVSPQCPNGQIWDDTSLIALLDHVSKKYSVDSKRVYVTGLSMGGYGTWSLISHYPERFAAAAPICGGGERLRLLLLSSQQRNALKSLPIWAFHGAKDGVVPLDESQRMIKAVTAAGNSQAKLTVYPDADHDSWTQAYNEPTFFTWLLSQSR